MLQTLILFQNKIEELPREPAAWRANLLLRELWLSGNPLKSVEFAAALPSLEQLHVSDAQVEDVAPLSGCPLLCTRSTPPPASLESSLRLILGTGVFLGLGFHNFRV